MGEDGARVGKFPLFLFDGGGASVKTTDRVEQLTGEIVAAKGFELCDVTYQKEYGNWVLTLFIDKQGGVTVDDCETVSRAVETVLDEADVIETQYYLSVSSLGLDRPLIKDRDFKRKLEAEVYVSLYAPLDGKKEYTGRLISFDAERFAIETDEGEYHILRKSAALVKPIIHY
jgi:ribosome maturation factor RimP